MNIREDVQAEMLFRSFKATSVPQPIPMEPPPTPGDLVRDVAAAIDGGRDEAILAADERAQALWQVNPQQEQEAPQ